MKDEVRRERQIRLALGLVTSISDWIGRSKQRSKVILSITQPMTVTQIASRASLGQKTCTQVLNILCYVGVTRCLNPSAQASRVYWFRGLGLACAQKLRKERGLASLSFEFPRVDWEIYGSVCFRHREAVILALTEAMQPSEIKRRARAKNPQLRMSANNVRDVIRVFLEKGIVAPVRFRKKAHLRYELTETGRQFQRLLMKMQ